MVFPVQSRLVTLHIWNIIGGVWFGHSNGVWLDEQETFLNLALKKAVAYIQGGLASR